MLVQCAACKNYFELPGVSQEQGVASAQEKLCNECLLAHIEKLVYGKSSRMEKQKQVMENAPQEAA
ncbi:MAG: hypothetical protein ACLFRE_06235 [Desulfovermiculus sp.]